MENEIKRFDIGDKVYFLLTRNDAVFIACGRVVMVYALDDINTKYIVSGNTFTEELYDSRVYGDPKELIKDLCSKVIS